MALVTLRNIHYSIAQHHLLDGVDCQIERGERIALIGRNGTGKTSLLKIINREIEPDDGKIDYQTGSQIAQLMQEVPVDYHGSVFDIVAKERKHIDETHLIDKAISIFDLDPKAEFSKLSGGLKRRVLLAKALVCEPDLLLLDEPTNHLDIDAIIWLEKFLQGYQGTILFITHDRAFLQKLATRIIELDRGKLTSWPGNYQKYLTDKQHALVVEERDFAKFDKKLSQEETWIRQGIKARRTRNEGRVRALKKLREQRAKRREKVGNVKLDLQQAEKSGKNVIQAKNLCVDLDGKTIINNLSISLLRGDKLGIVGPNGCGKTTLIKCLLGDIPASSGQCEHGANLQITFFDQMRSQLNEEDNVRDNVGEGSDQVTINGRSRHIMSYLQDFLFTPERANSLVKSLSGGERNRVLLAKLFTKPANVLVLDEPTNDLDIETLELLESLLVEFTGTIILVSHDREFLNNVVTSCLVYLGNGEFKEIIGDYDDYVKEVKQRQKTATKKITPKTKAKKLSYHEQRELDALPAKIEALEAALDKAQAEVTNPEFYNQPQEQVAKVMKQLSEMETALQETYARWQHLEDR